MEALVIFVPLLLVMYFFMIRPQQKRMREHQALLGSIDVGDEVVTESGLYGVVSELDGDTVFLYVADGVEIKVTKASIGSRVVYVEEQQDQDS